MRRIVNLTIHISAYIILYNAIVLAKYTIKKRHDTSKAR